MALATALLTTALAQAQPAAPIKFGKIEERELTAAPFAKDSAAAVVLCDFGETKFRLNGTEFQLVTERTTRVKILKKAGYDAATVLVPLYHQGSKEEKLSNLKGFTYNLVGGKVEKTKLETESVFSEERTRNVRVRKFALPAVREGSVIEYTYVVTSDFLFNFQDWTFQQDIPVRRSEYRAEIPEFFNYNMVLQGYLPLAVTEHQENTTQYQLSVDAKYTSGTVGGGRTAAVRESIPARVTSHRWAMLDVPAFVSEAFMTTANDYVARLNFELAGMRMPGSTYQAVAGDWTKISRDLLEDENFGAQLKRGNFLREQMQALATKYPAPAARAAAVRQVVLEAVRYDGTNRYATTAPLRKAYDAHRGTSADVNLLLIAALRDAGLDANPVLVSTRNHGRPNEAFAMLEKFNYVLALVLLPDGKELLVDATDAGLPCGTLPTYCLNETGRLIAPRPEEGRWVSLTPGDRHVRYQKVDLALDARGGLTGTVHEEHGGYAAAEARDELSTLGEKKYWAEVGRQHGRWNLSQTAIKQREDLTKPLVLDYALTQPAEDSPTAGTLYISPLAAFGSGQNPFRHETRTYPVDFGMGRDETMMVTLALPPGYELAEVPKAAVVELPDGGGRYLYSVSSADGAVSIVSRMNLRKPVYGAEEYQHLREFYRLMLEKQAERLVIKKKA